MEPYVDDEQPPVPRRRSGCMWGCLMVVLVVGLGVVAIFGYSAWYVYRGFESDPRLQAIMMTVRSDPRAEAVLGRNIRIVSVDRHWYGLTVGLAKSASYNLHLVGSAGQGELEVKMDLTHDSGKVTLMVLTGPDGRPHTLVGKDPDNPMDTIWIPPKEIPA